MPSATAAAAFSCPEPTDAVTMRKDLAFGFMHQYPLKYVQKNSTKLSGS